MDTAGGGPSLSLTLVLVLVLLLLLAATSYYLATSTKLQYHIYSDVPDVVECVSSALIPTSPCY
jgi:ABC-type polysaccharide/polyol phosphate export permease